MNRPLIVGVAAAVLAAGVSFWATRHLGCGWSTGLSPAAPGAVSHLQAELKLDERQADAISRLNRELAGQLAGYCGEYCAARSELGSALMCDGTAATNESMRLVDRMCAVQSESEKATLEHIRKVCALLTPEQRKQFVAGLVKCLCGAGDGCGGSCMKGSP